MPDMAELIQRRRDLGESYRTIAHNTGDLVDAPTVERWHKRQMIQFPRELATFAGWARALDENVEQVLLSMAAQIGVPVSRRDDPTGILPAGADRLTFEQRRALRALVRAIVDDPQPAPRRGELDLAAHVPADGEPRRPRRPNRQDRTDAP